MAYKFEYDKTATVKAQVATNENGNIATGEQAAVGNTAVSIKGIKKDATHAQTQAVFTTFVEGVVNAKFDPGSLEGTIKFKTIQSE